MIKYFEKKINVELIKIVLQYIIVLNLGEARCLQFSFKRPRETELDDVKAVYVSALFFMVFFHF